MEKSHQMNRRFNGVRANVTVQRTDSDSLSNSKKHLLFTGMLFCDLHPTHHCFHSSIRVVFRIFSTVKIVVSLSWIDRKNVPGSVRFLTLTSENLKWSWRRYGKFCWKLYGIWTVRLRNYVFQKKNAEIIWWHVDSLMRDLSVFYFQTFIFLGIFVSWSQFDDFKFFPFISSL